MKKTYIKPQAQAVSLFTEDALLSLSSVEVNGSKDLTKFSLKAKVGAATIGRLPTKTNRVL